MQGESLVRKLKAMGLRFAAGLSEAETAAAEKAYGLRFPPDFRALLKAGVLEGSAQNHPKGGYYNWRDLKSPQIRQAIRSPVLAILNDVGRRGFWPSNWGERRESHAAATEMAARHVSGAPPLVPVFGNDYLPQEPNRAGNPVIFFKGPEDTFAWNSLEAFLIAHARGRPEPSSARRPANLPFWDEWIEWGSDPPSGASRPEA